MARQAGELRRGHFGGEAGHLKIGPVHLEEQPGAGRQCGLVIGAMRPVCRSHLDERGSRACHDVGNPERASDFDQLAARDQRVAIPGQSREGHEERAGGVVHDERVLGTGELDE